MKVLIVSLLLLIVLMCRSPLIGILFIFSLIILFRSM